MSIVVRLIICSGFLLLGCWAGAERFRVSAQQEKQVAPSPSPRSQDGFGNVQVLKGVRDLLPTMHFIRASLGVRCDYCHNTQTGKYYLDDKPAKRRAREMIVMTRQLNDTAFGGKQVVTCNTCHRGSVKPVDVPQIATNFVNTTRVEPFEAPPAALPGAAEIFAKYESATHISTLGPTRLRIEVSRAKIVDANTPSARVLPRADLSTADVLADGGRGTSTSTTQAGQISRVGSNGQRIWSMTPSGPQWITAGDVAQLRRKVNPLIVLKLPLSDHAATTVVGIEKIGEIDAYVVDVVNADNSVETLWFSKRDGLLLRHTYYHATLLGPEPEQYDLSGYKRFGGVQLPTVINASYLDDQHLGVRKRLIDVKPNVTVSDKEFEPPVTPEKKIS